MKVVSVAGAECRLPLPRPIKLGPVTISTRDFVALRLTTDDGQHGDALGYTRGTALLRTLEHIAGRFLGLSPHHRKSAIDKLNSSFVNGRGTFVRAVSLLDIALHDLAAKAVQLPLYAVLGAEPGRIPASAVAGYYLNERTPEDVRDEVADLFEAGYRRVKIMIGGRDIEADTQLVRLAAAVGGSSLGVDAHWSWDNLASAQAACRRLDEFGLSFLEDPFGPHQHRLIKRLQRQIGTPLACGEDMPDAESLAELSRHVPVLRVDATTCGGISAACAAIQTASLNGCEIFPHIHHQLHLHLAAAFPQVKYVEVIPAATEADPAHLLLEDCPAVVDGHLALDEEPGAGTHLDWAAVSRYATGTFTVDIER